MTVFEHHTVIFYIAYPWFNHPVYIVGPRSLSRTEYIRREQWYTTVSVIQGGKVVLTFIVLT